MEQKQELTVVQTPGESKEVVPNAKPPEPKAKPDSNESEEQPTKVSDFQTEFTTPISDGKEQANAKWIWRKHIWQTYPQSIEHTHSFVDKEVGRGQVVYALNVQ